MNSNRALICVFSSFVCALFFLALNAQAAVPDHLWSKGFGSATNDAGNAVATDANGNSYLTGFFMGTASFGGANLTCPNTTDGCVFLAKFAPDGTPQWSKSFKNDHGIGNAVATDASGNVFLAGTFADADFGCGTLSGSIFAVKLAPDGTCLWSKPFKSVATAGTGNQGGNDAINSLAIDPSGNVFLAGNFGCSTSEGCGINFGSGLMTSNPQPSYGGIFLVKLSGTNGSYLWAKAYGGASGQDYARGVAVDSSGNAFITGYFFTSVLNLGGSNLVNAGSSDIFLAKYSGSTGAPLWSKSFGSLYSDYGMAIAIDSGGAAVIAGQFVGTVNFGGTSLTSASPFYSEVFLARYAGADGSYLWAKNFGTTVLSVGCALATDANGHIAITGYFMGTVDFGNRLPLMSNGGLDIFLAQYNAADGSTLWAKGVGGSNGDAGLGVAIDASGNTLMSGYFQGPADFGGGPINGGGALDIFIAKYGSSTTTLAAPNLTGLPSVVGVNDTLSLSSIYNNYDPTLNVSFWWTFAPEPTNTYSAPSPAFGAAVAPAPFHSLSLQTPSLASQGITYGTYLVSVYAMDKNNNQSPTSAPMTMTVTYSDFSAFQVYPNPWRADKHGTNPITFNQLPLGATVKIFTVSGHLLKTITPNVAKATWDLTNDSGDKVASGIYIYLITTGDTGYVENGQKVRGKLAIIK